MTARLARVALALVLVAVVAGSLRALDGSDVRPDHDEKLYFPSGEFLVESAVGFREALADWLWFRFIQYYGAFKHGHNDLRYLDLMVRSINTLDPRFDRVYHLASFIWWSDFQRFDKAYDILRRGVYYNPDNASLRFQIGFMHYVLDRDYERAAHWFEKASECSDATDREARFAAFARHKAGDERVSLALWEDLREKTPSADMRELADRMIGKLRNRLRAREVYGDDFIGPIPELVP